jgi:hypothetical protein
MAQRTASLYTTTKPDEVIALIVGELQPEGFTLTPTNAELVTMVDEAGEAVVTNWKDFDARLSTGLTTSFLWRRRDALSMYTRVKHLEATVIDFGMEGLSASEIRGVASALRRLVLADPGSIGMVFDPEGVTEDYDWDGFFLHQGRFDSDALQSAFPEAVVVRKRDLSRLGRPPGVRITALAGLILVTASPDWPA